MSDEGRSYVKNYSPFTGTTFWVHYVFGDIANKQHDYELFIGHKRFTEEWPISKRALVRAISEMVEGGYLTVITPPAPGRIARYRFEFEVPESVENDERQSGVRSSDEGQNGNDERQSGVRTDAKNAIAPITNRKKGTEREQNKLAIVPDPTFDDFWSIYPRRVAKPNARKAWDKAVKQTAPLDIVLGASRYAADPNRDPAFTAHPATWLHGERWNDDPLPSRGARRNDSRHETTIEQDFATAMGIR